MLQNQGVSEADSEACFRIKVILKHEYKDSEANIVILKHGYHDSEANIMHLKHCFADSKAMIFASKS